ncbi:MAG: hypothetical protein J5I41_11195 [Saprospiraceae bacterium]|nr:hypothetical protein [Saprospiraceae bacterium]
MTRRSKFLLVVLLAALSPFLSAGQGIQTEFGKNRVQYTRDFDEWVYYESGNFITYWYGESRLVGQAAVMMAEYEHDGIQRLLEHRMNDKIEIIAYTDLSDLKQSNIGHEEAFTQVTGRTKIAGNKIFVHFNGDHQHLRRQIREGIAEVYLDAMMAGGNIQEYVQNTLLFAMPAWFREGLIGYVGEDWDVMADDRLRRMFAREKLMKFEDFVKEDPALAGHAFWYYLAQQFGKGSVANILYISRIYRDVEEGMLYVLGTPYAQLAEGWYAYFRQRYEAERALFDPAPDQTLPLRNRHQAQVTQMALSPSGDRLAYVTNRQGRVNVWVQDVRTGKRKRVFRYGFRNAFQEPDLQYPLIDWHPSGQSLALLYEKRDKRFLLEKSLDGGEDLIQELAPLYQRVYSMRYFDAQRVLLTGATGGLSDVMLYHLPTRQTERITQDPWDDLDARPFVFRGKKGILFTSNREDLSLTPRKLEGILPTGDLDLYFYNYEDKAERLVRITQTPHANERLPERMDDRWFAWLSDVSGIYNRYIGYLDSVIVRHDRLFLTPDAGIVRIHGDSTHLPAPEVFDSMWLEPIHEVWAFGHAQSNAGTHILNQVTDRPSGTVIELRMQEDRLVFTRTNLDTLDVRRPEKTMLATPANRRRVVAVAPAPPRLTRPHRDTVVNYFQTRFTYPQLPSRDSVITESEDPELRLEEAAGFNLPGRPFAADTSSAPVLERFNTSRIIPSRLKFRLDHITNRFDNSMLFGGLDNYTGRRFLHLDRSQSIFTPPPTGLLIKADVKDLFEDYEFEGGMRIPTNFRGSEFFLVFSDKKRRWDKHYAVYRGDWSNVFDLNANVLNGPPHLIPPGLGAPGSPLQYKVRMQSTLGQVQWRYPLDIFRSVRLRATLRNDRYFWHALEPGTLAFPAVNEQRLGLRAEYVFDNTLEVSPNILNGMRYNIFTEVMKGFGIQFDPFNFDLNRGSTGLAGVDFRYYLPILKHSVFAVRFNSIVSFGRERILFYLGGVDNWLLPKFNNNIPVPDAPYAFQTLAANLRGFRYNIRNGSSFALANAELRIPVVRHLFPRVKSAFFSNLQLTGFVDAGTAWEGFSPYDDENPLNILYLENPPAVSMRIKYFRDPLVAGYGVGARSVLFGYFVKMDYAWGVETRRVHKPVLYLSIGTDF